MQTWIGFVKYSESPHSMKHLKSYKQFFRNNFSIILLILTVLLFSFLLFKLYLAIEGIRQFIWLEKQLENIEDEELEESIIKISNSLNKIIDEKSIEILGK